MKVTHIQVQYPTTIEKVLRTAGEMKALGYQAKARITYLPVNRTSYIKVKNNVELDLDALCVDQTGLTPSAYQIKHGMAWNE